MSKKDQSFLEFQTLLVKLTTLDVCTLAKVMNAPLVDENGEKLDGEGVLNSILGTFVNSNRADRRTILKIMRATVNHYHKEG